MLFGFDPISPVFSPEAAGLIATALLVVFSWLSVNLYYSVKITDTSNN